MMGKNHIIMPGVLWLFVMVSSVWGFESRPAARFVLYVDFDGEVVSGTVWNERTGVDPINAAPAGYTAQKELEALHWTAADYANFNINVTDDRAVFDQTPSSNRIMCIVTPTDTVAPNFGGYADLWSFPKDIPCWTFSLYKTAADCGRTVSHEVGHSLGLMHDGVFESTGDGGFTVRAYYAGHGSWATIMGASDNPVSQWSKGEYAGASNVQDDIDILANGWSLQPDAPWQGLGLVPDDHGSTLNNATPVNLFTGTHGLIEQETDVDVFSFTITDPTRIDIRVSVAMFGTTVVSNLDTRMTLFDAAGNSMGVFEDDNSLGLNVITNGLPAGTYYLMVAGDAQGTPSTGWSAYGSLGTYHLTLNIDTPGDADGLDDIWEMSYGLSPTDDGSGNVDNGPLGDPDGDGLSNVREMAFGTDPRSPTDGKHLRMRVENGVPIVELRRHLEHARFGLQYELEGSVTLANWNTLRLSSIGQASPDLDGFSEWVRYQVGGPGPVAFFRALAR